MTIRAEISLALICICKKINFYTRWAVKNKAITLTLQSDDIFNSTFLKNCIHTYTIFSDFQIGIHIHRAEVAGSCHSSQAPIAFKMLFLNQKSK